MNKIELVATFEDTQNTVNSNSEFQLSKTSKYIISDIIEPDGNLIANIQTINSDTVSAASNFVRQGKTAILNMASYKRPGGGVANGAKAQEECLFRCSNLFNAIPNTFYPLDINEGLYTNDAVFFKDKDYNKIDPFKVDVITVAAINLNKDNTQEVLDSYDTIMLNKIRLMFDMAYKNKCENIILGAWGCGVFNNNPIHVANMFEEAIMRRSKITKHSYYECFKNIIFAVINDHNSVGDNFDVFQKFF